MTSQCWLRLSFRLLLRQPPWWNLICILKKTDSWKCSQGGRKIRPDCSKNVLECPSAEKCWMSTAIYWLFQRKQAVSASEVSWRSTYCISRTRSRSEKRNVMTRTQRVTGWADVSSLTGETADVDRIWMTRLWIINLTGKTIAYVFTCSSLQDQLYHFKKKIIYTLLYVRNGFVS